MRRGRGDGVGEGEGGRAVGDYVGSVMSPDQRREIVEMGPAMGSDSQQRGQALVGVAGAVLEAVQDDFRLASRVANFAAQALGGEAGVWLSRADTNEVRWATEGCGNMSPALAEALSEKVREHLADSKDGIARPVMISDDQPCGSDWLGEQGIGLYALFPIVAGGRLIGGLAMVWRGGTFSPADEDVEYAKTLAALSGITMFNARVIADSAVALEDVRRQSELIEYMSDAVISCDAEGRVVSWNAGAERVYGYTNADAAGCDLFALLNTTFLTSDEVPVSKEEVLRQAANGGWQGESRERRSDGADLIVLASLTGRFDREGRMELILVNRDITAQRRQEHQALHDALTGLPNRRMLILKLYDAYARACRHRRSLAVLFIDLDGFKPINDTYGHAAGDEVLKAVAARITATLRVTDTVARIGGDEFVVVLQETGPRSSVVDVTRRILDCVGEPIDIGGTSVSVLASIGVAHAQEPTPEGSADDLLDAADQAMYEAKRQRIGVSFAETW